MFSCGEEGGRPPGLHEAAPFQHIKGGDPSPLVGLGMLGVLCPVLASSAHVMYRHIGGSAAKD